MILMIFQGLSVARNCPAPVTILDIKRRLCVMNEFWKFVLKMIVTNILTKASLK